MKKIILLCLILAGAALLWIPRGPALPPGLTLAQINNPTTTSSASQSFTGAQPQLTLGANGGAAGQVALAGSTSGTATITAPAIAGTSTNAFTLSNILVVPGGAAATPGIGFATSTGTGIWLDSGPAVGINTAGTEQVFISPSKADFLQAICYTFNEDVCGSRVGAKLLGIGTGANGSTAGFIKTAQTLQITAADVTCGTGGTISPCVAMQTITGLSVALPLVATNWSFTCDLIVSQATAAAANQIGVQTATNGATNLAATAIAYTAAATSTSASITGVASTTTAQSVVAFTPGATGTKLPVHMAGTIEGASASGTVFNVTALTGAAADLLTIYRGSTCHVY